MLHFPRKTPSWWHKGNILPGWHRQDSPLRWSRGKHFSRWNYCQDITVRWMSVFPICWFVSFFFLFFFLFTPLHTASIDMVKRWWSLLMGRERSILHCTRGGCTRMEPLKLSIGMGDRRQNSHLGGLTLRNECVLIMDKKWTSKKHFPFIYLLFFM